MFARYFAPLFLVLLAAAAGSFYINKEYSRIALVRSNIEQLKGDIQRADTVNTEQKRLQDEYAAFPVDATKRLAILIPPEIHPARLIMDVGNIASKHSLQMKAPAVDMSDVKSSQGETTIAFSVVASYSEFKAFLSDIEKSLLLREPASITVGTMGAVDGKEVRIDKNSVGTYQMQLRHFWMK